MREREVPNRKFRTKKIPRNMLSAIQQAQLEKVIDNFPEFHGAEIGLFANGRYQSLRNSNHATALHTVIVLEESTRSTSIGSTQPPSRRFGPELVGAGLNCLGMVLSGVAVGAETLGAPLTAGSSAGLLFVTAPVASASALQCGLSLGRVSNSIFAPESNQNLDSSEWFNKTSTVLDAIALVDAARGAGEVSRFAIQLRKSSNRPFVDILKSMTRAERKQLTEEIGRYTTHAATRRQFLNMVRSGKLAKILTRQAVNAILREKLLTAVSSALAVSGSALSKNVSTTTGLVNEYLVHVLQET
jgi:hypothetical protein